MSTRWRNDFPVPTEEDSYVTRREFTKFLGLTSLAFLVGTVASAGRKLVKRAFGMNAPSIPIAGLDEIPVGGYKLFRYPTGNDPCILVRLAADRFEAFDQRCTHLSCPVYFDGTRRQLLCPCHVGIFSAEDGSALEGPPRRALRRLTVSAQDAQIWVQQTEEIQT